MRTGGSSRAAQKLRTNPEVDPRDERGDGASAAPSGDEIFRRLWEVPHVLPDGPVEVGTTWQVSRGVTLAEPYSTDIETRSEVVEVLDGDVWVEFSGNVLKVYRGSRGRYGTEGTLAGRFGFRLCISDSAADALAAAPHQRG